MKSLRSAVMGIAVLAMIVSLSGLAFANMGRGEYKGCKIDKGACAAQIKTLRDSATALQASNPDLSKGLNDLADKKAEMMQKWQERKDRHDAKVKLFKDSSTALQVSNPTLAQELQKMSEKKHGEKEDTGETTESND